MRRCVIVCNDELRAGELLKSVQLAFEPPLTDQEVLKFRRARQAQKSARQLGSGDFALLSFAGVKRSDEKMEKEEFAILVNELPRTPVFLELYRDTPVTAFNFLKRGAFDVWGPRCPMGRIWSRIRSVCQGLGAPRYQSLVDLPSDRIKPWAFLSMAYESEERPEAEAVYGAVTIAWKALGLSHGTLRADTTSKIDLGLHKSTLQLIDERDLFLALLSTRDASTPPYSNVLFEVGYAVKAGRQILYLWREGSHPIPIMCPQNICVQYANYTELALALFHGLKGDQRTDELLAKNWRDDSDGAG